MNRAELITLLPYIAVTATVMMVLLSIAFYRRHKLVFALTLTGLVVALYCTLTVPVGAAVGSLLVFDTFARFFITLILAATLFTTLLSFSYLQKMAVTAEEYYLLLLMAALGSLLLVTASHFVSFFLGLEILSISLYALIAYRRTDPGGIEAGIKYLVLAAASASFLVFGMALIYFHFGALSFPDLADQIRAASFLPPAPAIGAAMLVVAIGFKLAVAPFHLWTPEIYAGAPAPVTGFVATVSKGAMFALLMRFFMPLHILDTPRWFLLFSAIAVASMFVGNFLALRQQNLKKLLAYSSIAHLGYVLTVLISGSDKAVNAAVFYFLTYFVTTLGAFGVITALTDDQSEPVLIADYKGLAERRPWLTVVLAAMMFSLAGIPLTAGFIGKYYILALGAGAARWFLMLMLVLNSAIGLYYYLRVVVALFSPAETDRPVMGAKTALTWTGSLALAGLLVLLLWLGIYPQPFFRLLGVLALP